MNAPVQTSANRSNPRIFASLAVIVLILIPALGYAQDRAILPTVLELPALDEITFENSVVIEQCSKLLQNRDKHDVAKVGLALKNRGAAYLRTHKYDAAAKDFDDLCMLLPKNVEARCLRAQSLSALRRYQDAFKDAKEALRLDPGSPQAHLAVAVCLVDQERLNEGMAYAEKAISLEPKFGNAYYFKGIVYVDVDPQKCVEAMTKYLELCPHLPLDMPEDPYYCRGYSLSLLNRPQEALNNYLMARKLNSSSVEVSRELAITYDELGLFRLACHYAEECIRIDPKSPVGSALAANYYAKLGNSKHALKHAANALSSGGRQPSILTTVGNAYFVIGRFDDALDQYQNALRLAPDHRQSLQSMAEFRATCPEAKFRNGAEAVKLARSAYERKNLRDWQKWQPAIVLAQALAETGSFEEAVRYAKEAVEAAGPNFVRKEEFLQIITSFENFTPWRKGENATAKQISVRQAGWSDLEGPTTVGHTGFFLTEYPCSW